MYVLLICLSGLTLVSVGFAGVGPVGGVDYPRTYQEFRAWFPDDVASAAYLARSYPLTRGPEQCVWL